MQNNFKTQAFGFNKKEVIDYIYELTTQKDTIEYESRETISALSSENENVKNENQRLAAENAELEEKLSSLRAELADANIQKSRLFEENNENRRMLLENEREFNIKNEQISKLVSENEDYAAKCAKFAEISENIGKTIMEAKTIAEEIVKKAEAEAEKIRNNARKTADNILGEVALAKSDVETLKMNFADAVRACEGRIKTVELNLDSVRDDVLEIKGATEEKREQEIPQEKSFF